VSGAVKEKVHESLFIYNGPVSHYIFYIIDINGIFRHLGELQKATISFVMSVHLSLHM